MSVKSFKVALHPCLADVKSVFTLERLHTSPLFRSQLAKVRRASILYCSLHWFIFIGGPDSYFAPRYVLVVAALGRIIFVFLLETGFQLIDRVSILELEFCRFQCLQIFRVRLNGVIWIFIVIEDWNVEVLITAIQALYVWNFSVFPFFVGQFLIFENALLAWAQSVFTLGTLQLMLVRVMMMIIIIVLNLVLFSVSRGGRLAIKLLTISVLTDFHGLSDRLLQSMVVGHFTAMTELRRIRIVKYNLLHGSFLSFPLGLLRLVINNDLFARIPHPDRLICWLTLRVHALA